MFASNVMSAGPSAPKVYATWNPSDKGSGVTLTNGNLTYTSPNDYINSGVRASKAMTTGKWYCESTVITAGFFGFGIADVSSGAIIVSGATADNMYHYYGGEGALMNGVGAWLADASGFGVGAVIGLAFDADNDTAYWYLNGVLQLTKTGLTGTRYFYAVNAWMTASSCTTNFGATPFAYPVPSGYNAGLYTE